MVSFNNILCAVDFDRNSLLALRVASELTRSSEGLLHIFHVVGIPSDASSFEGSKPLPNASLNDWLGRESAKRCGTEFMLRMAIRTWRSF